MKALKKPFSVLLALIMAFSAFSISVAAEETEISAGETDVTAEREPFIPKPEDCWVDLDRQETVKGTRVKITAIGSCVDLFSPGTPVTPVEGDIRMIPVKWTAKQVDNNLVIGSGEWSDELTVESAAVETLILVFKSIDAVVTVRVEVEFARQKYENGSWETTDSFTDSNIFKAATSAEYFESVDYFYPWIGSIESPGQTDLRSLFAFLRSADWAGGKFGLAYVARAINYFIRTRVTSGNLFSEIIRAIAELFS